MAEQEKIEEYSGFVTKWLEHCLKVSIPFDLFDVLPEGIIFCKALRKVRPDLGISLSETKNQESFLKNARAIFQTCVAVGVPEPFLFKPEDFVNATDEKEILKSVLVLIIILSKDPISPKLPEDKMDEIRQWTGFKEPKKEENGEDEQEEEEEELSEERETESEEELELEDEDLEYIFGIIDSMQETSVSISKYLNSDIEVMDEVFSRVVTETNQVDKLLQSVGYMVKSCAETLSSLEKSRNEMGLRLERLESSQKLLASKVDHSTSTEKRMADKKNSNFLDLPRSLANKSKQTEGLSGTFVVTVLSASGLKQKDSLAICNPYCVVRIGRPRKLEKGEKTEVIMGNNFPRWQEAMRLADVRNATILFFSCRSANASNNVNPNTDESCGQAILDLSPNFTQDKKDSKPFTLKLDTGGTLTISVKYEG